MIKIIVDSMSNMTVEDLINNLSKLPKNAKIDPFGAYETALAYDEDENRAYMDEVDFIEEMVEDDDDED